MKQAKWIALVVTSTALAVAATPHSAEAAALKWNLEGATLSYNAQEYALIGSFIYDDSTNTYSEIAIRSFPSDALTVTYNGPAASDSSGVQLNLSETAFAALNFNLELNFADSLVGKTVGNRVLLDLSSSESVSILGFPLAQATFTRGAVVAIPTPALLPGLVGIGIAFLRKRKATD